MTYADKRCILAVIALSLLAAMLFVAGPGRAEAWPRQFVNADGSETEIAARPQRIFSTSVTITGTLLAIEAPVIASAADSNGRFFAQWEEIAKARGVENVWPAGSGDLEAVYAARPDLIIVAASGADSLRDHVAALRQVAPVLLVNYSDKTWQELAVELGAATGLEETARQLIAGFDAEVAAAREKITIPAGKAAIISYNGPGMNNPVARVGGTHAGLLAALGFDVEDPDPAWHTQANQRQDFVFAPYERLVDIKAETVFLMRVDDAGTRAFLNDPVLANIPAIRNSQVYGLGVNSFRIDYYSGREIVNGIVRHFGT